jgi:predicted NBD/HSP70 family sugar kinase
VKRGFAWDSLKHQSTNHFAGVDVSVKETSVCIVDDTGNIVYEVKVTSELDSYSKTREE